VRSDVKHVTFELQQAAVRIEGTQDILNDKDRFVIEPAQLHFVIDQLLLLPQSLHESVIYLCARMKRRQVALQSLPYRGEAEMDAKAGLQVSNWPDGAAV